MDDEVSFTFNNAQLEKLLDKAADRSLSRASSSQAGPSHVPDQHDDTSVKDLADIVMETEDLWDGGKSSASAPEPTASELCAATSTLMSNILSPSTVRTYQKSWYIFKKMTQNVFSEDVSLPISVSSVTYFITYLHVYYNLAPSTIRTHLSGLSFVHKMKNIYDPVLTAPVNKLLKSLSNKDQRRDVRLPITRSLLKKLVNALYSLQYGCYDMALYKCMFLLAWHACLRLPEFTASVGNLHCLKLSNFHKVRDEEGNLISFQINFTSFKHKMGHYPALSIEPYHRDPTLCAFTALKIYLQFRGSTPGPLFLWNSQLPVTRSGFTRLLKQCVKVVDPAMVGCTSHSFRIGRATQALEDNMSVEKLIQLGLGVALHSENIVDPLWYLWSKCFWCRFNLLPAKHEFVAHGPKLLQHIII